ncbi:MAG: phosphotransferase [Bdellovibrionales bacterium]|nr:phosphotransferase [Bdellovibrionales bacterium]
MNAITKTELIQDDLHDFLATSLSSEDFQVFALAGDASNRKYYRIVHKDNSYVLMSWEPFIDNNEYPFLSVLNHFKESRVQVPTVIAKEPTKGLVLLEDLGDLTLERKFWEATNQNTVLPFYKSAIDEIIKIHYVATANKNDCTAFHIAFDVPKFTWELNYAKEHYLERYLEISFSADEAKALQKTFLDISTDLDKEPKVICHRDYHSRNLMFKMGKMFVIDFQDARLGPIQYDLVSLLKDSYVNLNARMQEEILLYYFSSAKEKTGKDIDRAHFDEVYSTQIIQRCFKACGSFASFYNTRSDTRYLKYLKKTTETVLQELLKVKKYPFLAEVIQEKVMNHPKFKEL